MDAVRASVTNMRYDCCWCWWWGSCWQQFVEDLEAEVWSKSLTFVQTLSILVNILKIKFRRDFEAEAVFCCWCLVEVTKLNLGQNFKFKFSRAADIIVIWSRFVNCKLVIWTQPSGLLYLWQCFTFACMNNRIFIQVYFAILTSLFFEFWNHSFTQD